MKIALPFFLVLLLLGIPRLGLAFPHVDATATSTETADTTTHTVNLPAGVISGDLLVLFFAVDFDPSSITLSGWTGGIGYTSDSGNNVAGKVLYRIADGTEGSTVTVTTGSAQKSAHQTFRIVGWHGITTPEKNSSEGVSAAADPPSVTASWGAEDNLWLIGAVSNANATFSADPANYTDALENDSGGTNTGVKLRTLRRSLNAATENPGAFTNTNLGWIAFTMVIRPHIPNFSSRGVFRGGP